MSTNRKKKRAANKVRIIQWALVVVLFAALIFVLSLLLGGGPQEGPQESPGVESELPDGRFASGTLINGVDVSGLDSVAAKEALTETLSSLTADFALDITYDGSTWTVDSESCQLSTDVDQVLTNAMEQGGSHQVSVSVSDDSLLTFLKAIAVEVNCAPTEPAFTFNPDAEPGTVPFTVAEGENGVEVDVEASKEAVTAALAEGRSTVELTVTEVQPSVSSENTLSNISLISSFTTEFSTSDSGRTHNLILACEKLNGISIAPDSTFSFNEVVGPRDEAHGWKEAKVIIGGSRYEDGWGGGICQVSTTLYNALLLTGADFDSFVRVNHSIPSGYVDKGLDATVAYDTKDLKFTNSTGSTLYVVAYVTDTDQSTGKITFDIYGKQLPEGMTVEVYSKVVETLNPPADEIIYDSTEPTTYKVELQKPRKGYVVEAYRKITVNGESTEEKLYTDTYKAVQGIYTVGTGSQQETTTPDDDWMIPEE